MPKLDNHYAVLVAINRYPGLGDLNGPENDALEFRDWLLDAAGGNLDEKRIEVIRSSDFPLVTDPYDANPTETQFKKVLNRWVKRKDKKDEQDDWLGRVGERLYLFFAGHGFTAGTLTDPALFTAQAQNGDTAHIAGLRYASKIRNAGFFDEIVLVMDCCQDVLKASEVGEPTWNSPDRNASDNVMLMEAYAAPRGKKARETPGDSSPVHGYFSSVFMHALRSAPADDEGFVTAQAVAETALDTWESGGYIKLTGVKRPPIIAPPDMRLYRRSFPVQIQPQGPGPTVIDPSTGLGPQSSGPVGPSQGDYVDAAQNQPIGSGDFRSSPDRPSLVDTTIASQEHGALIRVLNAERQEVASGIGRLQINLQSGQYTARFRVGDEVQDRPFELKADEKQVQIEQGLLAFSSPVPLPDTSTTHEFHYGPAMDLGGLAVQRAYQSGFPDSVGTLMVFARDSAHKFGSEWPMPPMIREGLRLRKLDEETGQPQILPCEPVVDHDRGYCSILLNDLSPGTYLLGVRRLQRDYWSWQEMALTVAPSWWRTEVYLDSIDDEWSDRRFDIDSVSVLIVPGKGSGSLYGSDARFTEIARQALLEGRLGVDEHLFHLVLDMGMPAPMLALYTAYALSLSPDPDVPSIRELCKHLRERWTGRSADVKLLERWCSVKDTESAPPMEIDLKPDEVPMIAHGWELSRQLGFEGQLALGAQYHVGMWRTSGSLWTETQVPDSIETVGRIPMKPLTLVSQNKVRLHQIAATLKTPNPKLSPLQQALRRALLDAVESDEPSSLVASLENVANASGLSSGVVLMALNELVPNEELTSNVWLEGDKVQIEWGLGSNLDDAPSTEELKKSFNS